MIATSPPTSSRHNFYLIDGRLLLTALASGYLLWHSLIGQVWSRVVLAADPIAPLIQLEFASLNYEDLHIEQARIQVESITDQKYRVRFNARSLEVAGGQSLSHLTVHCEAALSDRILDCAHGELGLEHAWFGKVRGLLAFEYHLDHGLQLARLQRAPLAGGRLALTLTGPAPGWQMDAQLEAAEVESARPLLQAAGAGEAVQGLQGRISGTIQGRGWPLESISAVWTLEDVNYSGTSAVQSLSGGGVLQAAYINQEWRGEGELTINSGELYLVPALKDTDVPPGFYIDVGERPLGVSTTFRYQPDSAQLAFEKFQYEHPGVVSLRADGRLQLGDEFSIQQLDLKLPRTDLGAAFPVYLQPWLIDTPYNDLKVTGTLGLNASMSGGEVNALQIDLVNVDVLDKGDRFSILGLATDLQLGVNEAHRSSITWAGIDMYRIAFGAGKIGLASNGFDVQVRNWHDVAVLDGALRIGQLDMKNPGTEAFALHMAGALQGVSLPALTTALEWPALSGTLSGEFSGLNYVQGDLRMDGELLVRMFDGQVILHDLSVRDLFGRLPVLTADISVAQLDLLQLTDTFAFGKITGKLSGYIRDLRLENWQPVAFDAELSTRGDGDTRHRISQKALNNLSQIGGGLSGALSRGFLRYFDEYSYGELGLSCRLAHGFCQLGGVEQYKGGHYLLTRGGLLPPWVEVKLAGTVVAWDTLIDGFRQIAEGEVKVE